jgi:hypothetical protein
MLRMPGNRKVAAVVKFPAHVALFCLLMMLGACNLKTSNLNTSIHTLPPAEVVARLAKKNKTVVSFLGYSGAQYEDPAALQNTIEQLLREFDPAVTIINSGATAIGIGAVYPLARRMGFTTSGIVSTQARESSAELSKDVDDVFFVEDSTWGGFVDSRGTLSPTSAAMVQSSDVMIAIGGGEIARDELKAAQRLGKEVRFIPADMNHQVAREKAKKKGLPPPTSFAGAVDVAFE